MRNLDFSADGNYEVRYKSNVLIYPDGEVLWIPPAIYQVFHQHHRFHHHRFRKKTVFFWDIFPKSVYPPTHPRVFVRFGKTKGEIWVEKGDFRGNLGGF